MYDLLLFEVKVGCCKFKVVHDRFCSTCHVRKSIFIFLLFLGFTIHFCKNLCLFAQHLNFAHRQPKCMNFVF